MKANVLRAGHAVYYVTDLERARAFYVGLLGLDVVHEGEDALFLRGVEEREWSLKVALREQAGAGRIAFKVASDEDLDALLELARQRGLKTQETEDFGVPRLVRLEDPSGLPVAFYARAAKHARILQDYHRHRGPGVQRIDHFNVMVPDVQRAHDFYAHELGFRLSEYTVDEGEKLWAAWLQRKGNVHDLALMNGLGPRLHHVGLWTSEPMSLIRACDILASAMQTDRIERGPGRHGLSNAMFLYLRDDDGNRIELYSSDYLTVDPDVEPLRWTLDDPRRQTLWGHAAPESWFIEASSLETLSGGSASLLEGKLAGRPQHLT
ncbi:3,4-dihydroxyphenylacetate 2,3-dioxygenase [soil metagenome]